MCILFPLWLKVGHGNTETALEVENDGDLSALQCCNTRGFECRLNISIWLQSSQSVYHSGPEEGRVHLNRSQELSQDYRFSDTYFIFICSLSVLFCAAHSGGCCLRGCLRPSRWNENFKPLTKSSGTGYTPNLTKLGGSIHTHEFNVCQKGGGTQESFKDAEKKVNVLASPVSDAAASAAEAEAETRRGKAASRQERNKLDICWHFFIILWKTVINVRPRQRTV